MQTYLQIKKKNTGIPQAEYWGRYELRAVDYEFSRAVGCKGEITSEVRGGKIRVAIEGFADSLLMAWLFDPIRSEGGVITTLDETNRTLSKLHFAGGKATAMRLNYDSQVKNGLVMLVTIDAREIRTDNDLYFERKKV